MVRVCLAGFCPSTSFQPLQRARPAIRPSFQFDKAV
jgi:hypothetical protein